MFRQKNYDEDSLYQVFGSPGNSMNSGEFVKKFGKKNSSVGKRGEVVLFHKLRNPDNGWLDADIPLFCSLIVPGKSSDIDFAMVRGNKILLVDAKMYRQDGGWLWNFGDSPAMMKNFSRYRTSQGKTVTLSRSMIMAVDILSRKLPQYQVEAIVVHTTDSSLRGAKPSNCMFLTYPGGIKAYNDAGARRFIKRFFRSTTRDDRTEYAIRYLSSLTH